MAITTTYEFLPEIWNLIKEYAIPEKYEYEETQDCVYEVEIYRFLETMEDSFHKREYDKYKMVVQTNGEAEDTTFTFENVITGRSYTDVLNWLRDFQVSDGYCKPRFSNWCRAEFMLSELMPQDFIDEWVRTEGEWHYEYTDLHLVIEMGERGNAKRLIWKEDPVNPVHFYNPYWDE